MKLLLTSAGLTNDKIANSLAELIDKPLTEASAAFILTAKNNRDVPAPEAMSNQIAQLAERRIPYILIDPSFDSDWRDKLAKVDVVIIGGGNTFHLLNETRKTGFDKWLKENIDKKIYAGISAGSIIMTPNIAVASIDDGDENTVGLTDLSGLGFVDFEVSPHTPEDVSVEANKEYAKITSNKLLMLDNNSAAIVKDNHTYLLGGEWA